MTLAMLSSDGPTMTVSPSTMIISVPPPSVVTSAGASPAMLMTSAAMTVPSTA